MIKLSVEEGNCVSTYTVNNKFGKFISRRCLKYINKNNSRRNYEQD